MKSRFSGNNLKDIPLLCLAVIPLLLTVSCRDKVKDLDRLGLWMTGSFSSTEQAVADSNFYDIRLHMVRIWEERRDGIWLYVEQAAAENLAKPYRQRVYRLTQEDENTFKSAVYTLNKPLRFASAWQEIKPLVALTPDSLNERAGCAIILRRKGNTAFMGSTMGRSCPSELRGASYATSEVTITATELVSWDRGFDVMGNQVWGSTKGGYIFKKQK